MISSGQNTSILISSQLPEFIRDDNNNTYRIFVSFLKSYYEWMEENGGVTDRAKNLLNYKDIDKTSDEFLDYFYNDFLSYIPKDILADKRKLVKFARHLYQTKGTPESFKLLFRALFDTEVEFFYTKDAVLKASSGKWYVAKSLRLASTDENFLTTKNLRIFGETTKSIATIENVIVSGNKMEVFISDIERLFQSGEFVRVVDSNNQNVLFDGNILRSKIVGQISQIKIAGKNSDEIKQNRGGKYKVGDPVIVYGGLSSNTGIGATAYVSETTKGSINRIKVEKGGYGYTTGTSSTPVNPLANTFISVSTPTPSGALVVINGLNPAANGIANVSFIPTDVISNKQLVPINSINYGFSNIDVSNTNTKLLQAFTFTGFSTSPIASVIVKVSGGGIDVTPVVTADTFYQTQNPENPGNLKTLGILAPIQITNGGHGYQVNDKIILSGGRGFGAYANVLSVLANGCISTVGYVYDANSSSITYPLGGMGYNSIQLPSVTVVSSNVQAANASLYVPGILGDGAIFSVETNRVGEITTITLENPGEDYISQPNVTLKIQDIVVSNVAISNIPVKGDSVYQGESLETSSYKSYVADTSLLYPDGDPLQSLYRMRVYNYNSTPNYDLPIKVDGKNTLLTMTNRYNSLNTAAGYDSTGVKVYGDSTAKATATFLNGLVISQGQYLDTTGQPSSFDVLQSENYNNYTYELTLEKEIEKYRETLYNLVHPSGMKVIGRFAMKSSNSRNFTAISALDSAHTLGFYTGDNGSYATMQSDWNNQSNNIVKFYDLVSANVQNFIFANNSLRMITSNGAIVQSEVLSIPDDNTVILKDNVWLTYANVAYVTANSGSSVINIGSLTNTYNLINNGIYTDPQYPLKDIVLVGDKVLVANNTERTVSSINYEQGTITLSSSITSNAISLMSVKRTVRAYGDEIRIYGPVGLQYFPELTTEDGLSLTTEDDYILLLG